MAQPNRHPADNIAVCIADLMALEERMRLGHPTHRAHDDQEEEAQRIVTEIRAVFPDRARTPVNAPVARVGTGYLW